MHARRRWLPLLGFPLLALFFCACQSTQRDDVHTFYVGLASPPTTLDPRRATDAYSQRIADLLFSALVRTGPDLRSGSRRPPFRMESRKEKNHVHVTRRFEIFPQRKARRFQVTWFFYSANFKNPVTPFASSLSAIESVENPDSKTVVLNLKEGDASLLSNLNVVQDLAERSHGEAQRTTRRLRGLSILFHSTTISWRSSARIFPHIVIPSSRKLFSNSSVTTTRDT